MLNGFKNQPFGKRLRQKGYPLTRVKKPTFWKKVAQLASQTKGIPANAGKK
jgi:hypothetical protein